MFTPIEVMYKNVLSGLSKYVKSGFRVDENSALERRKVRFVREPAA